MEYTQTENKSNKQPEFLRFPEVCELLRVSSSTCKRILLNNEIERHQLSQRIILYRRSDILKLIEVGGKW